MLKGKIQAEIHGKEIAVYFTKDKKYFHDCLSSVKKITGAKWRSGKQARWTLPLCRYSIEKLLELNCLLLEKLNAYYKEITSEKYLKNENEKYSVEAIKAKTKIKKIRNIL